MKAGDWVYVLKYPERRGQIVGLEKYGWLLIDFGDEQLPYHPQDVELVGWRPSSTLEPMNLGGIR